VQVDAANPGAEPVDAPARGRRYQLSAREVDVVHEALSRGATVGQTVALLIRRGPDDAMPPAPVPEPAPAEGALARERRAELAGARWSSSVLEGAVGEQEMLFAQAVEAEYDGLNAEAKPSFAVAKGEPFASPAEKYRVLRAVYYRAGWTSARTHIFEHIVRADLLGVRIVGGVHDVMLPVLERMERDLPEATKAGFAAGTLGVGGFVPRFIAGTDTLSNHAFGLALDIDPTWNPHVKGAGDVAAFRRATGADLGDLLFRGSESSQETRRRMAEVSELLKPWLATWLPVYQQYGDAADRARKARTQIERDTARREVAEMERDMNDNPASADLRALHTMVRNHTLATVRAWAVHGITTIDPDVIEAFREAGSDYQARWGAEYKGSKDMMHLELLAPVTLPAAGGRKRPADLSDLLR
jgi:uncharacterized protein (DUF4415 family)